MNELLEIRRKIKEAQQEKQSKHPHNNVEEKQKKGLLGAPEDCKTRPNGEFLPGTLIVQRKILVSAALLFVVLIAVYSALAGFSGNHCVSPTRSAPQADGKSETSRVLDFSKELFRAFAERGVTGIHPFFSGTLDDGDKHEFELKLLRIDPAKATFTSVKKCPGGIIKVSGSSGQTKFTLILDSSSNKINLGGIEILSYMD